MEDTRPQQRAQHPIMLEVHRARKSLIDGRDRGLAIFNAQKAG
jgi:hypothetical protein